MRPPAAVSIHAPREGRDFAKFVNTADLWRFNPRAREGRDAQAPDFHPVVCVFQSTRPVKGATATYDNLPASDKVSIHAPREGRDVEPFASPW